MKTLAVNQNTSSSGSLAREPVTNTVIRVGCPNLGDRAVFDAIVDQIFEQRWFTNGGAVEQEFEARLCAHLGVAHCIPVCNATVGLQLACQALELEGEVIMPAFTFVATPHAVRWVGLKPVFADVSRFTHCICPDQVESLITERTAAILGVHLWGNACATRQLELLAARHGLPIVYDAAHAFSCTHNGTMLGNFGNCEVFSFHATKFFQTFEGGAIATNDDALAHRIRGLKNFGLNSDGQAVFLGTNAKMSEVSAAMGISMFARIDELLRHNCANYTLYQQRLEGVPGLRMLSHDPTECSNWQYIVVEIDELEFGATRDHVMDELNCHDVDTKRYFYPGCHRLKPYAGEQTPELPNTDFLASRTLCLPTGEAVSASDVHRVCDVLLASSKPANAH